MNVWTYIPRLTEEYINMWPGHGEGGPRLHVIEEYILIYLSVSYNREIYFYIHRYRGI
jgi:hypothetical protein